MSIELHCPQCSKLIRAPDDAGGKKGKCPACGTTVYIPEPLDEDDLIPLAPIDQGDEEREERMRREASRYAAQLDKAEGGDMGDMGDALDDDDAPGEVIDVNAAVNQYILAMRDSNLDDAENLVVQLKKAGQRAKDQVQGLMVDEMPPNVENVPPALVRGFLKTLLSRLES